MSEDIVQRMRFWSETRNNQPTAWNLDCADAADEIERLRKSLDEISKMKNDEPYSAQHAIDALEQQREAL